MKSELTVKLLKLLAFYLETNLEAVGSKQKRIYLFQIAIKLIAYCRHEVADALI